MTETVVGNEVYCLECGYDLQGIDSDRCPECGGAIRAFWRTVLLVMFHPQRLAPEMNRPASLHDALKFRRIVSIVAMLVLAPATVFATFALSRDYFGASLFLRADPLGSAVDAILILCLLTGDWAFLLMAGGVASYFFHPRWMSIERQNRAIALSYYACAPMVFLPLATITLVPALIQRVFHLRPSLPSAIFTFVCILGVPLVLAISIWRTPLRLLDVATRCSVERQLALAVFFPVAWVLLAALMLVVIPLAVAALLAMVVSYAA